AGGGGGGGGPGSTMYQALPRPPPTARTAIATRLMISLPMKRMGRAWRRSGARSVEGHFGTPVGAGGGRPRPVGGRRCAGRRSRRRVGGYRVLSIGPAPRPRQAPPPRAGLVLPRRHPRL